MNIGDTFWQVEKDKNGDYYCFERTINNYIDLEFFEYLESSRTFKTKEEAEQQIAFYNKVFKNSIDK